MVYIQVIENDVLIHDTKLLPSTSSITLSANIIDGNIEYVYFDFATDTNLFIICELEYGEYVNIDTNGYVEWFDKDTSIYKLMEEIYDAFNILDKAKLLDFYKILLRHFEKISNSIMQVLKSSGDVSNYTPKSAAK